MRHRVLFWLAWWVVLWVLYVGLVFKLEASELVTGALCAALGATAAEVMRSHGPIHFSPGARWVTQLPALARAVLADTLRLIPLVWRAARGERVGGRMRCIAYPVAHGDEVQASSRRVLEKVLGSAAPNSFVVGFDEEHDVVLVHELIPGDAPPRTDWGAR